MDPSRTYHRNTLSAPASASTLASSSRHQPSSSASESASSSGRSRHASLDASVRQVWVHVQREPVDRLVPLRDEGAGECRVRRGRVHRTCGLALPCRWRLSSIQLAVYWTTSFYRRNSMCARLVLDKQSCLAQRTWLLHELRGSWMRKQSGIHRIRQHRRGSLHRMPGHPSVSLSTFASHARNHDAHRRRLRAPPHRGGVPHEGRAFGMDAERFFEHDPSTRLLFDSNCLRYLLLQSEPVLSWVVRRRCQQALSVCNRGVRNIVRRHLHVFER